MSRNPRNGGSTGTLTTLTTLTKRRLWKVLSKALKHGFNRVCEFVKNTRVHETIRHVFCIDSRTSNRRAPDGVSSHSSEHRISPVSQNTGITIGLRFQENPHRGSKTEIEGILEPFELRQIMYANSGRCQT